jgi:hypothetical protein
MRGGLYHNNTEAIQERHDNAMKPARPYIISALLALSTLVTMPSAIAQESVNDRAETGMFSSAARAISSSVGQWFGLNRQDSSDAEPVNENVRGEMGEAGQSGQIRQVGQPGQIAQVDQVDQVRQIGQLGQIALPGQMGQSDDIVVPDLLLEAFPALSSADDVLHSLDFGREQNFLDGSPAVPQELDLSASYIWQSPRFGQFIVSTNTTYVYNTSPSDVSLEPARLTSAEKTASGFGLGSGMAPELQSSLTFTWQIGNHTATAVTSYVDGLETFGMLSNDTLNIEQLNELMGEIATLDLSYGYNVKAGKQGNASISVGLRSQFDRRQLTPAINPATARMPNTPNRMAYGTIKYQF